MKILPVINYKTQNHKNQSANFGMHAKRVESRVLDNLQELKVPDSLKNNLYSLREKLLEYSDNDKISRFCQFILTNSMSENNRGFDVIFDSSGLKKLEKLINKDFCFNESNKKAMMGIQKIQREFISPAKTATADWGKNLETDIKNIIKSMEEQLTKNPNKKNQIIKSAAKKYRQISNLYLREK